MSIVSICEAEAAVLLTATQAAADQIKAAIEAAQPRRPQDEADETDRGDRSSRIDAVRAYFEEHHKRRAEIAAATEEHDFDPGKLVRLLV